MADEHHGAAVGLWVDIREEDGVEDLKGEIGSSSLRFARVSVHAFHFRSSFRRGREHDALGVHARVPGDKELLEAVWSERRVETGPDDAARVGVDG